MSLDDKIFTEKNGHTRWDYQIEYYLNKLEDKNLKGRIISSIQNLSNEFGRSFLKNTHKHHPINFKIANKAEHSIKWIIWLSESLIRTKIKSYNFDELTKKIRRKNSAIEEGILFLTIANWFATNDNKIEFEPSTENKKADIRIELSEIRSDFLLKYQTSRTISFIKRLVQ